MGQSVTRAGSRGGPDESVFQPEWSPDGDLYFVSDRVSGWGNLYRERDGAIEPMAKMDAEFGRPQWQFGIGALITLWSIWFCYRTMRENSFAAPVIKLQHERGQRVISTGPYAFVRHPMYFGAAFYFIGTALLLGSWWGVIFAFVLIGLLCIRIPIEEKALRAGLEGYGEYAAHVRYRLSPHVW
jgi:protein-S-isoprenylcysteine O-methyltransferase Ste14